MEAVLNDVLQSSYEKPLKKDRQPLISCPSIFNFFQQVSFVAKAKRQLQKSPTSIGGEMNAGLSCFSMGFQTSAEIEELSLRTPRPVATTE
ncbi:hypothetical protein [Lysinibacillus sp. NPDC056232]|uniref:hypothetical protein n=1 Tax=Lysinibacillus sp. NPDC056232 TaxID=3345756 RepID=UPI0035D7685F